MLAGILEHHALTKLRGRETWKKLDGSRVWDYSHVDSAT